jgi:hypothetical protein
MAACDDITAEVAASDTGDLELDAPPIRKKQANRY